MRSEEGDEPMTVEEMKKKKSELGFSCEQISARSGVPLGTVQKIFSGITKRPRYDTICQLEKAFPMEPDSNPYPGMNERKRIGLSHLWRWYRS
mgnify:CR=1 FL=1